MRWSRIGDALVERLVRGRNLPVRGGKLRGQATAVFASAEKLIVKRVADVRGVDHLRQRLS